MTRHIVCVLDRTLGHVSICWDYVSIFINKNSNYNKINQIGGTLGDHRFKYPFTSCFWVGGGGGGGPSGVLLKRNKSCMFLKNFFFRGGGGGCVCVCVFLRCLV